MKKTLVFGASLKPNRYSRLAVQRLVAHGIETMAYGQKEEEVSGIQIKTNFNEFHNIHTISLYVNPQRQSVFCIAQTPCRGRSFCPDTKRTKKSRRFYRNF